MHTGFNTIANPWCLTMPAVPEFILRKIYVPSSLENQANCFSFSLNNTFAPGTLIGFGLDVDRSPIPPDYLTLQIGDAKPKVATQTTPDSPATLPVGVFYTIQVQGLLFRKRSFDRSPGYQGSRPS